MTDPVKPVEPVEPPKAVLVTPLVPTKTVEPTREQVICKRLGEIIAENDGLESNIPVTRNEYWNLKKELNEIRTSAS